MTIKRTKSNRSKVIWWPWRAEPTVYISTKRGEPGTSGYDCTLAHELVHVGQWKRYGRFGFLRRYITRRGRLALEAQAYRTSIRWWLDRGITDFVDGPVFDYYANVLHDGYCLWFIPRSEVEAALR